MEIKLETYVHPSLEIEVPIEIRKQVYEKAIELVLVDNIFRLTNHNNLCILLPCILFGHDNYLDVEDYEKTPFLFPELTYSRLSKIENLESKEYGKKVTVIEVNEFRKQILKEMLNELKNK